MKVVALPPAEIIGNWGVLAPFFEEFERSSRGNNTALQLMGECLSGRRQCWVAVAEGVKAVALTDRPPGSVWLDYCTGSDREGWQSAMVDQIEAWTRSEGVPLDIFCRPGWARFLRDRGYREVHRHMRLNDG